MLKRLQSRLTYANVMSTIAVFGVLGGGAFAAQKITAKDIARNAVRSKHIQRNAVKSPKIAKGAVTAAKLAPGVAVSGPPGLPGEPGLDGTARAYARVQTDCPGGSCPFDHSKGVTGVTRISEGNYCVTAPGISAAQVPAAVTVDWGGTSHPEGNASAMTRAAGCAGDAFHVVTERQPDIGGGAAGHAVEVSNVGFTIVIP